MIIDVSFLPGTGLREALEEAKSKAELWNVTGIRFNFNEWEWMITKETDIDVAISNFDRRKITG
jgi:hypothetical protein